MSAADLKAIPGIGRKSVDSIMAAYAAGSIRTNSQLRALIGTRQVNSLRNAGFELRLFRNQAA
jgi:hypothetical protein